MGPGPEADALSVDQTCSIKDLGVRDGPQIRGWTQNQPCSSRARLDLASASHLPDNRQGQWVAHRLHLASQLRSSENPSSKLCSDEKLDIRQGKCNAHTETAHYMLDIRQAVVLPKADPLGRLYPGGAKLCLCHDGCRVHIPNLSLQSVRTPTRSNNVARIRCVPCAGSLQVTPSRRQSLPCQH